MLNLNPAYYYIFRNLSVITYIMNFTNISQVAKLKPVYTFALSGSVYLLKALLTMKANMTDSLMNKSFFPVFHKIIITQRRCELLAASECNVKVDVGCRDDKTFSSQ